MLSWQEMYMKKQLTAKEAIGRIKAGDRIFIGGGCSQPQMLVRELADPQNSITDAEIYQFLSMGDVSYTNEELSRKFRLSSFFVSSQIENVINSGHGDYIPVHLSNIPSLFKSGRIPLDVALIQTTPPDRNGNLSLGVSVDIIKSAVENSLLVIAEVNERMPRTMGDSFISLEQVDAIVLSSGEILEYRLPEDDPVIEAIARNVVSLIENGSTLQVGTGPIAQSIFRFLGEKRDIGIHSEMIGDYVVDLIESGVINGSEKTLNRGKITASFCMGTRNLYDFINENPVFEFRPSEYVNDPDIISRHRRMVAVNEAYEVDMTGQVCADSSGYGFSGGAGGMIDFARGASGSPDGKAIIALRSTSKDGRVSRIVPRLTEGSGVMLSRADVRYVVTEYGVADLFGKSVRERVLALCEIAHPDFRNEILSEARNRHYIFPDQKELPGVRYPSEYETSRVLEDGTELFFRPVKPSDEKAIRDMFYSLSEQSAEFRFYQSTRAFSHKFTQEFAVIDYSRDMAIAALVKDPGGEQIIGTAHYFLNPATMKADVTFVVRDDWQARGVGTCLLSILIDIARRRGLTGFEARVGIENSLMLSVFYNSGYRISTRREGDFYLIDFNFKERKQGET